MSKGIVDINNKDELEKYIKINKNNGIYNEFKEYKKLKDNFKEIISKISKKIKLYFL
ncbi:hypothetical protein [Clostridium acidisoli]|uniref:hypothetical protein n=1 Tax=Clostridium acidisoli TaxID=91624 RepID=UPI001592FB61|nr:hypothetical protein [Clostridium acidisoli]